ncbi:MAG: hypothetical protein CBC83_00635 [Flavobacteriales bacterium TMED123]|nr:MAG: hypothetical protein CBC83_00635 [Flavobacteriales bacterium TMED123]|tara:strand:+ start:264 stop:701 length:438 start_codon:yes stop_codon:yes gene_type:complete
MDKYTIEAFKPEHANYILSYGEVENFKIDYKTEHLITQDAWTGFYLGKPIVCGGIHPLWEVGLVAEVWIIMQRGQNKHKFFMLKNIKKYLEEVIKIKKYKRIQASIRADFKEGVRFAKWFGMESEGLMKQYGPDGKDYIRLARIE